MISLMMLSVNTQNHLSEGVYIYKVFFFFSGRGIKGFVLTKQKFQRHQSIGEVMICICSFGELRGLAQKLLPLLSLLILIFYCPLLQLENVSELSHLYLCLMIGERPQKWWVAGMLWSS